MATVTWLGTTSTDITTGANWSGGAQPTAADDVIITGGNAVGGGTLSSAGNLASLIVRDFTSTIGTSTSDLVVDLAASSVVSIDTSGKAYIDFNASDVDVNVYATATTTGTTRGLHLKGAGTNDLNVYGSASVLLLEDLDNDINTYSDGAKVTVDPGVTAVNYNGPGELICYGNLTSIYATGSDAYFYGTDALTTLQAESGARVYYMSSGAVTNINAYGGVITGENSNETLTVTNTDVQAGGEIIPGRNWTVTNNPTDGYKITAM